MLTQKQIDDYVKDTNAGCPFCGSDDIQNDGIEYGTEDDRLAVTEEVVCHHCRKRWYEVYRLVTIEEVTYP